MSFFIKHKILQMYKFIYFIRTSLCNINTIAYFSINWLHQYHSFDPMEGKSWLIVTFDWSHETHRTVLRLTNYIERLQHTTGVLWFRTLMLDTIVVDVFQTPQAGTGYLPGQAITQILSISMITVLSDHVVQSFCWYMSFYLKL